MGSVCKSCRLISGVLPFPRRRLDRDIFRSFCEFDLSALLKTQRYAMQTLAQAR